MIIDDEVDMETDSDSEQEVEIVQKKASKKKAAPVKKPLFKIDFDNGDVRNFLFPLHSCHYTHFFFFS